MQLRPRLGLIFLLLAGASTTAAAQGLAISDCSSAALRTLNSRIFVSKGKLRPLVFSRDVLHLTACEGLGPKSTGYRIEQLLKRDFLLENREITISERSTNPLAPAARDACDGTSPCVVEIYRRKSHKVSGIIPYAKSGGLPFGQFLGHVGAAGHYEITGRGAAAQAALAKEFWSVRALEVLKDAARDPDFYEWLNPAAHAQTRNDDSTGRIDQDQANAKSTFESWTRKWLASSEIACKEGRTRDALYLLGYSLHGVQDLVFHEGITNAEHSFRDFIEDLQIDAGDNYDGKLNMAAAATVQVLSEFRARLSTTSPSCWGRMQGFSGESYLYPGEKESALNLKGKDFGVTAYLQYRALATKVRDAVTAPASHSMDYFIAEHWLKDRQQPILSQTIARIFVSWEQ